MGNPDSSTPSDLLHRLVVAGWGVCLGALVATAITAVFIAIRTDTTESLHPSLLPSEYLVRFGGVYWQERYERMWYALACVLGALGGLDRASLSSPPVGSGARRCYRLRAGRGVGVPGRLQGADEPGAFPGRGGDPGTAPVTSSATFRLQATCLRRMRTGRDSHASEAAVDLGGPRLPSSHPAALRNHRTAPRRDSGQRVQQGTPRRVLHRRPRDSTTAPGVVPGLDFESHYGVGHAYTFSLVMGNRGLEKTLERFVLFVMVACILFYLSAFLVLTDWLQNIWGSARGHAVTVLRHQRRARVQLPILLRGPPPIPLHVPLHRRPRRRHGWSPWCALAGGVAGLSLFWQTDIGLYTLAAGVAFYLANALFRRDGIWRPFIFLAAGVGSFTALCVLCFGPRVLSSPSRSDCSNHCFSTRPGSAISS